MDDIIDTRRRALVDEFFAEFDPTGRRVLEVQCGTGLLRDHLERHYPGFLSYLGVDNRADAITEARIRRSDLSREFAHRDLRRQPLPPDSFDLVIALEGGPVLDELIVTASVAACRRTSSGIEIRTKSVQDA